MLFKTRGSGGGCWIQKKANNQGEEVMRSFLNQSIKNQQQQDVSSLAVFSIVRQTSAYACILVCVGNQLHTQNLARLLVNL